MSTPTPPPSPVPRRLALPRWLDVRVLAGTTFVVLSVAGGARLVASARSTVAAVAIERDLAAGTTISPSDLRLVQVQLPHEALARYATDPAAIAGKQLNRALEADELVPAAALGPPDPGVTVVVPLPPDSAPALSPGQRVSIWLSTPACAAKLFLEDLPVQGVHESRTGSFATAGGQTVVLRVAPGLGARVMTALALEDVRLRAVRVEGPVRASGDLPDLAGCGQVTAR